MPPLTRFPSLNVAFSPLDCGAARGRHARGIRHAHARCDAKARARHRTVRWIPRAPLVSRHSSSSVARRERGLGSFTRLLQGGARPRHGDAHGQGRPQPAGLARLAPQPPQVVLKGQGAARRCAPADPTRKRPPSLDRPLLLGDDASDDGDDEGHAPVRLRPRNTVHARDLRAIDTSYVHNCANPAIVVRQHVWRSVPLTSEYHAIGR
jgi:hypothetical protein